MKGKLGEFLRIEFVIPALIIVIAFLGLFQVLPVTFEQLVLLLLGFLAIDAVVERTIFFRHLREEVTRSRERKFLESRDDPSYADFKEYCSGAQEIFVCGLSLGYVATQAQFFFEERITNGCKFGLIIINPNISDEALSLIADHDERARDPRFLQLLRSEIQASIDIMDGLRNVPNRTGHLEVRAAKGLPVFTITMVNPAQDTGKMRIELRPYKRNQGVRPYFELKRQNREDQYWYDFFFLHYYRKLWDDSDVLIHY